jgi:general secretion pathway protein J
MKRARGFTLIELLVAIAIVAVIGAIALGGLSVVLDQQNLAREKAERWREIQFAMRMLVQDLAQLHPRQTRDEFGEIYVPSLLADPNAQFALELSRGGWSNPAGLPRGTVARVAYDWEDDVLVRFHWPVMDRTLATVPVRTELLEGVENIEVQFLDAGGEWHLEWPPLQQAGPDRNTLRPRAIEFSIELVDYGRVSRMIETSG